MKLFAILALIVSSSVSLLAQNAEPQTEADIDKLLPIPSTEFVPPPPPKEVPAIKVEATTTRTLPTHQITVLRGDASTLPDIPPPPEPKPFVQGPVGEPHYLLSFGATVYDHRISHVRWYDPRTEKQFEAWCGWDWTLLSPMPEINPHFPALRSGPTAAPGASLQKQIPSSHSANHRLHLHLHHGREVFVLPLIYPSIGKYLQ